MQETTSVWQSTNKGVACTTQIGQFVCRCAKNIVSKGSEREENQTCVKQLWSAGL